MDFGLILLCQNQAFPSRVFQFHSFGNVDTYKVSQRLGLFLLIAEFGGLEIWEVEVQLVCQIRPYSEGGVPLSAGLLGG